MIKLVIFDYDGLLVNSEDVVFEATAKLFASYDKELTWEYYSKHIGRSVISALTSFHKDYTLPVSLKTFITTRNVIVEKYIEERLELMPYISKLLLLLQSRNIPMAIASSGKREHIQTGLSKFKLQGFFPTIVTIDDVKLGKPNPDLILKVLELTHFQPNESVLIEDSPHGIEAASRAGVHSIAIPSKGIDIARFSKANIILPSAKDLYEFLRIFGLDV